MAKRRCRDLGAKARTPRSGLLVLIPCTFSIPRFYVNPMYGTFSCVMLEFSSVNPVEETMREFVRSGDVRNCKALGDSHPFLYPNINIYLLVIYCQMRLLVNENTAAFFVKGTVTEWTIIIQSRCAHG